MNLSLAEIATIRTGHRVQDHQLYSPAANARIVQMRDLTEELAVDWDRVATVELERRPKTLWLQAGDLVFIARGSRHQAVLINELPGPTVCSSNLFLIRVDDEIALPHYVATYINFGPGQSYLGRHSEGAQVGHVKKSVLGAMPIAVPSFDDQQRAIRFASLIQREVTVLSALAENRQDALYAYLASVPNSS